MNLILCYYILPITLSLTDGRTEMRFLLVHDGNIRSAESIKNFFSDMYELFVKVRALLMVSGKFETVSLYLTLSGVRDSPHQTPPSLEGLHVRQNYGSFPDLCSQISDRVKGLAMLD